MKVYFLIAKNNKVKDKKKLLKCLKKSIILLFYGTFEFQYNGVGLRFTIQP